MTWVWTKQPFLFPGGHPGGTVAAVSEVAHNLDGSGDKISLIFQAQTDDAITHLAYYQSNGAGTPPTYMIGLQGVGNDGKPDGTYKGGGSPASATFTPTTGENDTFNEIALANSYTPAIGEELAMVVEYSSGTIDGSNFITVGHWNCAGSSGSGQLSAPYNRRVNSGGGYDSFPTPIANGLRVKTTAGRYGAPVKTAAIVTLTTSGHRAANSFTLPRELGASVKVRGLCCYLQPAAAASITFAIWNASGVVASKAIDGDNAGHTSIDRCNDHFFSSIATLTTGKKYYAGIQADGTSIDYQTLELGEADDRLCFDGGTDIQLATFDGSSWSEDTTKLMAVGLILDGFVPGVSRYVGQGGGLVA